ncbi:MAG TPA: CHRD domain-containing protein, partial [Miltoncostaeaceae bacterium]|nr:CHRD domain-containing protein [Miltoncostaeaceae bacterium]
AGAIAVIPVVQGLAAGAYAAAKGPAFAKPLGSSEAPTKGDPDGRGSATIPTPSSTRVRYAILVSGIGKPNAAHIHRVPHGSPATSSCS